VAAAGASGGSLAAGLSFGLAALLGLGGLGLALWRYGHRAVGPGRLVAGLTALLLIGAAGAYFAVQTAVGHSWLDLAQAWKAQLDQSFDQYVAMRNEQVGGEGLAEVRDLQARKTAVVWALFRLSPSFLVLGAAGLVLLNVLLARRLLPALTGFELNLWRPPDAVIWVVLGPALGLLPQLLRPMLGWAEAPWMSPLFYISLNVTLIALAPYVGQGLAVMSFFMKRWRFPRFLRGLTYFMVLTQGLIAVAPALGLMEFWANWRARALARPRDEERNDEGFD
jgi:hypothetical protein